MLRQLVRTATFRLALIYLVLFAISVSALFGFVYWTTAGFIARQTDATIAAEITGLAEEYRQNGLRGLSRLVRERGRGQRFSLYLLTRRDRTPLAGNLDAWPRVPSAPGDWLEFDYARRVGAEVETREARARHFQLRGGFHLLVGRDIQQRREIESLVRDSLVWAVAITVVLGLIGGVVTSRGVLGRIQAINRTSREIMAGDLGRRVAVAGSGDELDRLAANLNAMLDQIERLMSDLRQVTDGIAHDLRTPLNRLRGRLEVSLLEAPGPDEYRRVIEESVAEIGDIIETFDALLRIAQVEAGAARARMGAVDLAAIARDVAELYQPLAEQKGLDLVLDVPDVVTVHGERHLLAQALANLLDNAIKYTAAGAVRLTLVETAAGPELSIADSGPGIAAADRDRVQERLVRLDADRTTPGSGLGLSLVRAVAALHGATLRLDDNEPGLRVVCAFPPPAA